MNLVADCWIGCDRTLPLKLKVNELTRAEREGRTNRGKALPLDADEEAAAVQAEEEGSDADEEASGESGEHLKLREPAVVCAGSSLSLNFATLICNMI